MATLIKALCVILIYVSAAWAGVNLDETDDFINTADSPFDFERTDAFSLHGWFKNSSGDDCLFGKILATNPWRGYQMELVTGTIRFLLYNSPGNLIDISTTASTFGDGAWHAITTTYDGSSAASGVTIYIDNSSQATSTSSDALSATILNNINLTLGSEEGKGYFGGSITDFAVYSVELTAQEVAQLHNSDVKRMPLQVSPSNLVAYWPLDDCADGTSGDGVTFRDQSGNGNNGTGNDGANNTGLTCEAEQVLTYP